MRNRGLYALRERLSLTSLQRSVLVGALLGDGALIPSSSGRSDARLQIEHKAAHREYVLWTYEIFHEWVLTPPFWRISTNSWRFRTISHPELGEYRSIFYHEGRKVIPANITEYLDAIGLAVWLMDDGGLDSSRASYSISVHGFMRDDVEKLRKALTLLWGLESSIQGDGKGDRLYIPRSSARVLQSLIMPYVHPCMMDRLSLTP